VIVIENQSLLDVAIQEDGSVLAAFEWAVANGISITDDLAPGQNLSAPNSSYRNADVANYFKGRKQMIATAIKQQSNPNLYDFPQGEFPISF
jgi:capsid protein